MQNLFGEILLAEGLIDGEKLRRGLDEQARSREMLGAVLVKLGYLSENDVLKVLSIQLGLPFLSSEQYPQSPPSMDHQLSLKFLKQYKIMPIECVNGTLTVATAHPEEPFPLEAIKAFTGLRVAPVLGTESGILDSIEACYGAAVTMEKIAEGMEGKDAETSSFDVDDVEHLKDMASEAPIINLVNILMTRAVERRASDIHVEPFENVLHVRYRVDGILYQIETLPRRLQPAIASRIKIMSKLNIAERRLPQDGRVKLKALGRDLDIRVSTIPTLYGESIVMRLLDPTGVVSLENIGFSEANKKAFSNLVRQPHGMMLVTGPTGSGKSTTLYAALSEIDKVQKKVITIEDPVEYNLEGVNQIHVKPRIGLTFASGLRSIVRQDPDVIMVGEVRDTETADVAIHSALTGHLILSTLHTNDAPGAVTRLIDMGVESYLISSSLLAVLAQRLVRVLCPCCKEFYALDMEQLRSMGYCHEGECSGAYRAKGCSDCDNTGYRGRTGIFELMPINDELRKLIVEKRGADIIRQKAVEQGMITLRADGWDKVRKGITTIEEVTRVTVEQNYGSERVKDGAI